MDNNVAVSGNFEIIPCDKMTDIENKPGIKKLELTSSQKIQMGGYHIHGKKEISFSKFCSCCYKPSSSFNLIIYHTQPIRKIYQN